jgi:3-ketosteroid 9alpha-monooxygenase subunit B
MAGPPLFRRATVKRIVPETRDARTYVLAPHGEPFGYRAGQFCTFRVRVDGRELLRSYSMCSAPETDTDLMTTVKRVPGGAVSNWLLDHVAEGDELELTEPRGLFTLRAGTGPVLGFSGGSGITPILSLAKSALAGTDRAVRLLCADRDAESAIFDRVLAELADQHRDRLSVVRHLDSERGLLDPDAIAAFVGADGHGDAYVCGPDAFMALVSTSLPGPGQVYSEHFDVPSAPVAAAPAAELEGTITIHLGRKKVSVPHKPGETLLESARRGGLLPPFSCEAGNCATCIARLTEGEVTMRVNDILEEDEIADGYVLTCQSVPDTADVTVRYE